MYELMDTLSGNLVGAYESLDDALSDVRESVRRAGAESFAHFALGREDEDGSMSLVAEGDELVSLARYPCHQR